MRLGRLRVSPSLLAIFAAFGTAGIFVAPGVSANASNADPTPTQFVNPLATPSALSYPGGGVTISGALGAGGTCPTSLAKTLFMLSYSTGGIGREGLNVKTDATCNFSVLINEVVPAPVLLQYVGNSTYAGTSVTLGVTAAQVFPAKIVMDQITPAKAESTVTATGTVFMQLPDQMWVPSPYAPVDYVQQGSSQRTFADQNGQFRIVVGAYPGQAVTVSTQASDGDFWWSGPYSVAPFYVPLAVDPTSVVNIGVDQNPSPVGSIGLNIHVVSEDAAGIESQYSGPVQLFFQPAAGGNWTLMASKTTASGFAHVIVSGYLARGALAAGNWKWVVPAEPGFGASGTQPFAVVITVPTKISGLRFGRSGTKERLTGRLSYKTAGVAAAPVVIEHFSGGRWRNVATVHTNSTGGFSYAFSRRLTGRYRVRYRGGALPGAEASFGSFESTLSGAVRFA